jgi:hypothetical protein
LIPNRSTSFAEADRERAHDQVGRQERETDLQRGVAEHELEVEGREEEPGEHGRGPEDADDVRGRDAAQPEDPERHERRADTRLDPDEEGQQHRRGGEQTERLARGPALVVAVHDRVDGQHQRPGHGDRAGDVEPPARDRPAVGREQPQAEGVDENADRDVDEKDPVPAEKVRQHPAEEHADAPAACHHEAEDAHRLGPVGRLREEVHDQRERDRRDNRTAEALDRTRRDQEPLRRGQAAGDRGQGEERDPDQEQSPVAEQIAEAAAEQEEAAERQQVGVDHPGERRRREPEVLPNRRQRDVHDRRVENDHQVAQAQDDQREPAGASIHRHQSLPPKSVRLVIRPAGLAELIGRR